MVSHSPQETTLSFILRGNCSSYCTFCSRTFKAIDRNVCLIDQCIGIIPHGNVVGTESIISGLVSYLVKCRNIDHILTSCISLLNIGSTKRIPSFFGTTLVVSALGSIINTVQCQQAPVGRLKCCCICNR